MDKRKLKIILLKQMCECAQNIQYYFVINNSRFTGIDFGNKCPISFKPGIQDKIIFNKIIEKYLRENSNLDSFTGTKLMVLRYYPFYGMYHTFSREKVKKRLRI